MDAREITLDLRACIDVDDVERAIAFYTEALGLHVGRRFEETWVELLGGPIPLDLLGRPAGSPANPRPDAPARLYERHWTPVHLDFVVGDIDLAVERVLGAGGALEGEVRTHAYGRLARMVDPFGHGFCLLEFRGRGYDEILERAPNQRDA
ncbi:MAG TPA: VOC family protein [Vicinamibacterales bacterium]|nr:VOC family protein [Vicinamibacterales bacterium]